MATTPASPVNSSGSNAASARSAPSSFGVLSNPDPSDPAIRIAELGQIDRVMWEANLLFAQGRLEEVRSSARAIQEKGQEVGYDLAIALLRLDGNKEAFEDLAVEYAVQTGNSPPVWLDTHDKHEKADAAPKRVMIKIASLMAENIIETTIKMESPWPLTLDFSEVTKVDAPGLDIFQESLTGRISREESTMLVNTEKLVASIVSKIRQATYNGNAGLWTFCFNTYRLTGNRHDFDELTADFVEKTGEDMPVFKDLRDEEEINRVADDSQTQQSVTMGFDVGDVLSGVCPDLLKKVYELEDFNSVRQLSQPFALDFASIKRWTIMDMSNVLQMIRQAERDKVTFEFLNLNELLLALFKGFGVEKHVRLVVAGGTT